MDSALISAITNHAANALGIVALVIISFLYFRTKGKVDRGTQSNTDVIGIIQENTKTNQQLASVINELTQWLKITRETDRQKIESMYEKVEVIPVIKETMDNVNKTLLDLQRSQNSNCTECLITLRQIKKD